MPFRWYPPEALKNTVYDKSTDVWSYGILLWEIMTDARKVPYAGLNIGQVLEKYLNGYKYELPDNTPEPIATIFTTHVLVSQKERKTMTEVCTMIEAALDIKPRVANKLLRKEAEEELARIERSTK